MPIFHIGNGPAILAAQNFTNHFFIRIVKIFLKPIFYPVSTVSETAQKDVKSACIFLCFRFPESSKQLSVPIGNSTLFKHSFCLTFTYPYLYGIYLDRYLASCFSLWQLPGVSGRSRSWSQCSIMTSQNDLSAINTEV